MKIKEGVSMTTWLVIPSAGKSGMEMEQNTHSRNDIRYSLGARERAWVREFTRADMRRDVRSRANKFPFKTSRCSTLVNPGIEFHGEFRDTSFGCSTEDRRYFVGPWRE